MKAVQGRSPLMDVKKPCDFLGATHGRRTTRYEWKKHLLKYSQFPIPYSLLPAPCSLLFLERAVVAADLDPQADLSTVFLGEDRLEELWLEGHQRNTIFGKLLPLLQGLEDISDPHLEFVTDQLALLVGDIELFQMESHLSELWSTGLYAQDNHQRELSLDFFALRALTSLGITLQDWRKQWEERLENNNLITDVKLPLGKMEHIGYVVLQHSVRFDRPAKAYQNLLIQAEN